MPRERDNETATTAAAAPTESLPPPTVEAQAGLPDSNPPVAPDYLTMPCWWWNGDGPYTIEDGQTMDFPTGGICFAPMVRGHGLARSQLVFCFDIVEGSVSAVVGVTNPSEFQRPCRPYTGVCYPSPTIALHAGQRVHLHRVDYIDQSALPADVRTWEMNPGMSGGSGRGMYPSLAPTVTAQGGRAVIKNIQIEAFTTQT